jgi:hypothetical protein
MVPTTDFDNIRQIRMSKGKSKPASEKPESGSQTTPAIERAKNFSAILAA